MAISLSTVSRASISAATTANPVTLSSMAIGTAATDRIVVAVIIHRARELLTAVTIGGVTATKASAADGGNFGSIAEVWYAAVPTGTTANVVLTFGSNTSQLWGAVSLFRMVGSATTHSTSPTSTSDGTTDTVSVTPTIPTGGVGIFGTHINDNATPASWTNATEYDDTDETQCRSCSAYRTTAGSTTVSCSGASFDPGVKYAMASAIFGPFAYNMPANVGAYTLSGQDSLRKIEMDVAAGAYVLSGIDAALSRNVPLITETGVYVLSGQDVADIGGATYTLDAAVGAYALTGNDAGTLRQLLLACATGTYDLVGQDSTGDFTLQLTADVGAYILSGQDTTGDTTYRLSAEVGGYTLSGIAASLLHGYTLPAAAGSFALTGIDVAFLRGYNLVGEAGSYELSGQDVRNAFEAFTMIADQGAYNIIGVDVTLRKQARRLWVLQSEASSEWTEEAPRARRNVH